MDLPALLLRVYFCIVVSCGSEFFCQLFMLARSIVLTNLNLANRFSIIKGSFVELVPICSSSGDSQVSCMNSSGPRFNALAYLHWFERFVSYR